MKRIKDYIRHILLVSFVLAYICGCANPVKDDLIKVLILSGKNNHEWKKTTPLLLKIYKDSRLFKTIITEKPDTLTYNELKKYDVVVSNWNSWPDNDFRMTKEWENDFLKYVREGGGVVSIHAGASSFYRWDEYHQIGIGRWGKETNHGKPTKGKISGFDQTNPITTGLRDFYIVDEIWEKTDICPGAKTLASVSATDEKDGHLINDPSIFVNQIEKGRSFFTTLGHDERALLNSGLQIILLRATQWAANRKVTINPLSELKEKIYSVVTNYSWNQSDTTLSLMNNSDIIWQYNFNNRFGKTYFHPVSVRNSTLTCASPPDHPWHNGLWFSWKYVNGVNYWEYLNDFKSDESGYKSEGNTNLQKIDIARNTDFSADIRMEFLYIPEGGNAVMSEKRDIHISPPLSDGSYFIDHENICTPLIDEVILDRTPVEVEPGGKSWGGYAGLSIRFNQDLTSPEIIVPTESGSYRKNNWLYMGFNTLTGDTAGICILQNIKFTTQVTSWYVINNPDIPFFYYSPAVLFDSRIVLKKGDSLNLKYRVWIIPGKTGKAEMQAKYEEYVKNISEYNQ
jgi:type 1 glutamine amidotransferase